jgi:hypothetical protein
MMTTRLRNSRQSDEANVNCVSYPRQPDGCFYVPEDVAQLLLATPAGFYRVTHDDHLERREMRMDFLAQPNMHFEVGGRRFEADENGIIAGVPPGNYTAMLNMGACPLPPAGWVDPRPVTVK